MKADSVRTIFYALFANLAIAVAKTAADSGSTLSVRKTRKVC